MIDLAQVRADTPGCLEHAFLDSAGSALPPDPVLDAALGHLRREAQVGGYLAAAERAAEFGNGVWGAGAEFGSLTAVGPQLAHGADPSLVADIRAPA